MFIIRNVTRETVRFIIRNVTREIVMFIIRKVTRESGNVYYQKRYKGDLRSSAERLQCRAEIFVIRNVTRENANVYQKRYKAEWNCSSSETLQGRPSPSSSEALQGRHVHHQNRYKGECECSSETLQGRVEEGITQCSNFTPLGQVPRHSPLVPPTVSTSPSLPRAAGDTTNHGPVYGYI